MMDNPKFKAALIGGGVFGVLAALPYISMLNALYIGGGVLAVYFHMKDRPRPEKAPYGDGALVGLIAGAIGGVVTTVLGAPCWHRAWGRTWVSPARRSNSSSRRASNCRTWFGP